jgi:hypothetical protein
MELVKKQKYLITFFLFFLYYQVANSNELTLTSEDKLEINELNLLIK